MDGLAVASRRNLLRFLKEKGIHNQRVLDVMAATSRDQFVDEALVNKSYEHTALPIGFGQFIPAPHLTAKILTLLLEKPMTSVLEIGTGSGYQTALLAKLVDHVATIERVKPLQIAARKRLKKLDLHQVSFRHADGFQGWASKAPFSGIIVNGSVGEIPKLWLEQLTDKGMLIAPLGSEQPVLTVIQRRNHHYESSRWGVVRCPLLESGIKVV